MGFFGVWAPGVLPFPVVIPLKDRVVEDRRARAEVAEAQHELEDIKAACRRVLADPSASGDEIAWAVGTVTGFEVGDARTARDTALANHDAAAASAAEQRIIAAYAAMEEACDDIDSTGPAPSDPHFLRRVQEALGDRFEDAMTLWRRADRPAPVGSMLPSRPNRTSSLAQAHPQGLVEALNESTEALAVETEMLEANTRALLANAEAQRQAKEQDS